MFGFGAGFVLTQFGLRWMQPWVGVAISIPTSTLLFWCLAPFFVDPSEGSLTAVVLFACVGLFFPGAAALLNFESNRLLGPNIAGALSSMTPVFAVLLFALLRTPAIASRTGFPQDQFPVAAAQEVEKLPSDARILAPDKFGGYLIYRFQGARKVFFDGRSDLYGSEFLKQYARLTQLRPGWRTQLDEFGFTHALLPNEYSLVPALEALGWRRLYRDDTATLLAR